MIINRAVCANKTFPVVNYLWKTIIAIDPCFWRPSGDSLQDSCPCLSSQSNKLCQLIEGVESKMGSPQLHRECWEARCLSLRFEVVDQLSHPADSDLIDLSDVTFAVLHFSDAAQISYSFYDELVLICRNISKYGTRSPRGRVIPSPARMQNMTDFLRMLRHWSW